MRLIELVTSLGVATCLTSTAWAHRPTLSDGSARGPSTALVISDVDLSQVIYHEITAESPQLWLGLDLKEGQSVYFQLGVPLIERLRAYRPALALIGPQLPPTDLPFGLPEGLGAIKFTSEQVAQPREFHEPFSGTSSWILSTQTVPVVAAGRYYLVAYDPAGQPGKLWVALGKREEFTLRDIAALKDILPKVRQFHEVEASTGLPCFMAPAALAVVALGCCGLARGRPFWRPVGPSRSNR